MKFCPRCRAMISADKPYCNKCQPIVDAKRKEAIEAYKKKADKRYDKKRDPKYRQFYTSHEWRALSRYMIVHAEYQCEDCRKDGRVTVATEVHHIKPIQTPEGWQQRLDQGNLVVLCPICHNNRHKRFGSRPRGDTKKV